MSLCEVKSPYECPYTHLYCRTCNMEVCSRGQAAYHEEHDHDLDVIAA